MTTISHVGACVDNMPGQRGMPPRSIWTKAPSWPEGYSVCVYFPRRTFSKALQHFSGQTILTVHNLLRLDRVTRGRPSKNFAREDPPRLALSRQGDFRSGHANRYARTKVYLQPTTPRLL